MGHKVNPVGIRLRIVRDWTAKWYASGKNFANTLNADILARQLISKELMAAGVSDILIERLGNKARIIVHVARPGTVIGRKGEAVEKLSQQVSRIMGIPVHITIQEVRKPELDATLVAKSIAEQLERRVMFRRAMKRAISSAMRLGAKGIKINVAGRLGGAEIARNEIYREGRVPLHTFRADIDYGTAEAKTTYGIIGVKVWIFKGEVFGRNKTESIAEIEEKAAEKAAAQKSEGRKPKSDGGRGGRRQDGKGSRAKTN